MGARLWTQVWGTISLMKTIGADMSAAVLVRTVLAEVVDEDDILLAGDRARAWTIGGDGAL